MWNNKKRDKWSIIHDKYFFLNKTLIFNKVFTEETMNLFTRLLVESISYENELERIRKSIYSDKRWDYLYAFDLVNKS